ncbi:nuclear transport factor 2 family protein [Aliifodinibius sp. S!AR15-10]|uniref:nuclear transport factor 2 family protein n=1 Tax=Aliifodinibius sp. S!AR15-10 TaxID=2950437 RepID=UPI0028667899|nr:nuclear transport factor 2 family protein [Aliifodinibius sp. S!AR15-10]MDR8394675.1 nuclear transport factor 2 family protein [Aliifodinibius sp. S!AR15-10]
MTTKNLINKWFQKWEDGDFLDLPISNTFKHTSPFGTINGKQEYLTLVKENKDKFLGYHFEIHDEIVGSDRACVRYTAVQGDFTLDVSEWFYVENGLIESINSYYHIGEIRDERKISKPE